MAHMMNHDGSAALADTERERVDAYVAVHELDDQFAALRPIGRILKSTTSGIVAAAAEVDTELGTIASVCDAIRRIAFQARLLSLNARLEASRAGDAGRAFGVVAGEFNTFATEITNAAAQINKSVEQALSAASRNEDAVAALADAVAVGAEVIARLSAGHAGAESTADLQHVEVVRFA